MTVISRIALNPQRRGARKLIGNRQAMHAAVEAAFPPGSRTHDQERGRTLWRLDVDQHCHRLYVVSLAQPDLTHVMEQAGWAGAVGESADYGRFLASLRRGQQWRFRLAANPVRSVSRKDQRGLVMPHVTPAHQVDWLLSRAESGGFSIPPVEGEEQDRLAVEVTGRQDHRFGRRDDDGPGNQRVTLRVAQFDGVLEVTDVEHLRRTLTHGLGRAKGYGCGLLTLRPLEA